jgi:pseudouridine-5'-phosphate glycosidase
MDVSADLQELRQTPVAVVCAGAKQILDIGRTLEYLETMGVPVLGNATADFPAFYCRKSGYGVDYAAKDEEEIASILRRSGTSASRAACSSAIRFRKNTRWTSTIWRA